MVERLRRTHNGAVMRLTYVMNLGFEPRTSLIALSTLPIEPRRLPAIWIRMSYNYIIDSIIESTIITLTQI